MHINNRVKKLDDGWPVANILLLAEKFMQPGWLWRAAFQPNLKYLHVEITVAVAVGGRLCLVETMADSFPEFDDSEIE